MSRQDPYFRLRIPEHIKEWVEARAIENRRSMTAEINFILETIMKNEKSGTTA